MSKQEEFEKIAQALDEQAVLGDNPLLNAYLEAQAEAFRKLALLSDDEDALAMLTSDSDSISVEIAEGIHEQLEGLIYFMTKE